MKSMAALVRRLPVNMVLLAASYSAASAASIPFAWDPSRSIPGLAVPGSSFTADTINTTNYLYSINQANGSFVEQFIVRINSFELNGQPVSAPGLNSSYGLYFSISATGQGSLFNNLDISLMADPGNTNGAVTSTLAGVSFANGTAGDFLLGTGMLASASLALDSAGVRHAHFVETFAPAAAQTGFFINISPQLEIFFTTPPANFSAVPQPNGSTIQMVNGGSGQIAFVPEPGSLAFVAGGLVAVFFIRRLSEQIQD